MEKSTFLSQYPQLKPIDDLLYFDHFTEQTYFSSLYTCITAQVMPDYLAGCTHDNAVATQATSEDVYRRMVATNLEQGFSDQLARLVPRIVRQPLS